MKRTVVLAAAAFVASFAGVVQAKDRICSGEAEAADGSSIEVSFTVDKSGAVSERGASWSPPSSAGADDAGSLLGGAPNFTINYAAPTAEGLGSPHFASAFTLALGTPQAAMSRGETVTTLADGRAWRTGMVSIDSKKPKPGAMDFAFGMTFIASRDAEKPYNVELLPLLETAPSVTVAMFAEGGRPVGKAEFVLSDKAARDALFAKAWADAAKAAETPRKCKAG